MHTPPRLRPSPAVRSRPRPSRSRPDNSPSSHSITNVLKSQPSMIPSNGAARLSTISEGIIPFQRRIWRPAATPLAHHISALANLDRSPVHVAGVRSLEVTKMATASISASKAIISAPAAAAQPPRPDSQRSSVTFRKPAALSSGEVLGLGVSGSLSNKNELRSARASASAKQAPRLRLEVTARTAGAAKQYETEVDKPLGLTLGQNPGGRVIITQLDARGNASKAGLKVGDQVIYTSSFFGDELWPVDKLGFTKTAINAKPDSVYFVVARGADVDVKRLPKRPAPPRFGRKLTEAQKARATHVCLDCGYVYTLSKPFDEQPESFQCPQCQAPKKRFAGYDPETGNTIGGQKTPIPVIIGVVLGAVGIGAFLFLGLQ